MVFPRLKNLKKKKIINKTFCMVNCVNSQNTNSGVLGVFGRNSKLSIEKIHDQCKNTWFLRVQNRLIFVCCSGGLKFLAIKVSCIEYFCITLHFSFFILVEFFIFFFDIHQKIPHVREFFSCYWKEEYYRLA